MEKFRSTLEIIDGNPFVYLPPAALQKVFEKAAKSRGPIPVIGVLNERGFSQTLVKYKGHWRLYVNMKMLPKSPQRVGEVLTVEVAYDPADRTIPIPEVFLKALKDNPMAHKVFKGLSPSRQKEIIRYIAHLKTDESVLRNVRRAVNFLLGKESFVGRQKP